MPHGAGICLLYLFIHFRKKCLNIISAESAVKQSACIVFFEDILEWDDILFDLYLGCLLFAVINI